MEHWSDRASMTHTLQGFNQTEVNRSHERLFVCSPHLVLKVKAV